MWALNAAGRALADGRRSNEDLDRELREKAVLGARLRAKTRQEGRALAGIEGEGIDQNAEEDEADNVETAEQRQSLRDLVDEANEVANDTMLQHVRALDDARSNISWDDAPSLYAALTAVPLLLTACQTQTLPPTSPPTAPIASPSAGATPPAGARSAKLRWTAQGTLDEPNGTCSGTASIARTDPFSPDYPECWALTNERSDCPTPDIDWLTEGEPVLCRGEGGFVLVGDLPGRAQCFVAEAEIVEDRLRSLTLNCDWECRSQVEAEACAGSALYRYGAS